MPGSSTLKSENDENGTRDKQIRRAVSNIVRCRLDQKKNRELGGAILGEVDWLAELSRLVGGSRDALRMIGPGGAPTRATLLPDDPVARKKFPIASGVMDYFPDAICAVSEISQKGNDQHNPGQPLHWNRGKSPDEADTMLRHFLQRGTRDVDGIRHTAKMAWRALALLQKELEAELE